VGHADISALLQRHRWNISHAAEDLGISRNTLYRRMHRLGILTPRTK
jgi:transcriptional regulator of acetoin/glycerol metabolism